MEIPLAQLGLREKDLVAAISVLNSGNLTMGDQVVKFEKTMARYTGTKHFVMVNSGSSANLALFESLLRPSTGTGVLSPGDGVLVPILAWPTTIWPILQLGLVPHFVDVEIDSLRMDLDAAQTYLNMHPSTVKGMFVIHPLGYGARQDELTKFAEKNSLLLLNDVCESLGAFDTHVHAGTLGIAATFSFYFSHHITTIEGGGIATNNDSLADDLRSIRSHGWARDRSDKSKWDLAKIPSDSKFQFVSTGFNIRPLEIQAAIGSSQMEDVEKFLTLRRRNAKYLFEKLRLNDNFKLIGSDVFISPESQNSHSWMMFPIIAMQKSQKFRDEVVAKLNHLGIDTRPILSGNFLKQPASMKLFDDEVRNFNFPSADYVSAYGFLIGNSHTRSLEELDYLSNVLAEFATTAS
jgi:CDP-6-deoxy-D-xylo-4-hexulose-3-dehydrase